MCVFASQRRIDRRDSWSGKKKTFLCLSPEEDAKVVLRSLVLLNSVFQINERVPNSSRLSSSSSSFAARRFLEDGRNLRSREVHRGKGREAAK